MKLPAAGELNRRIKFEFLEHVATVGMGFEAKVIKHFDVWGSLEPVGGAFYWGTKQIESGVTHRIFVRAVKGMTRPQDISKTVRIIVDGQSYEVRRVADVAGKELFTVIDVAVQEAK